MSGTGSVDGLGTVFVIAAPSGAGKTSLVRELLARNRDLGVAISHTTRPQRPGEESGRHYHFVTPETFQQMVAKDCFIEHATVFGHLYGTSKESVVELQRAGKHILLEIDWQGAAQVRSSIAGCTSVFILPPSIDALRERLHSRGQDEPHIIERRLAASLEELSHYHDFDYLIVNDLFDEAVADLESIIRGDPPHLRVTAQQESLKGLLAQLLSR